MYFVKYFLHFGHSTFSVEYVLDFNSCFGGSSILLSGVLSLLFSSFIILLVSTSLLSSLIIGSSLLSSTSLGASLFSMPTSTISIF